MWKQIAEANWARTAAEVALVAAFLMTASVLMR
jgi:hypothetical protein